MADLPGNLSFASFIRQGLAAGISRVDKTRSGSTTVVPIAVNFTTDGPGSPLTAHADLLLVGPGDLAGLDSRVICRVWPKADDNDAESGSLPLIEFDQADLPWRYTPASATPGKQLRPWINLVVLSDDEGFALAPPTPAVKVPVLTVDAAKLPNLDDAWGWAHTQFSDTSATPVSAQIKGKPGLFTSRIISPRVLANNTRYLACLVPTFARGRLAGTGQDPGTTDALDPAWTTGSVQLPVYYYWRFATGSAGSFRQLARLIVPEPLPPDVGRRSMDVSAPGLGFPPISNATPPVLDVEGAIQSLETYKAGLTPAWPAADQGAWVKKLKTFLDTPTVNVGGTDIKVVAPPFYGRWNAAQTELNAATPPGPGTNPPWFYQLNADPRSRVGGGLGTVVIQNNQQALLASGWKQVGDVRLVKQRLKVAQFGREVVTRVFERHVVTGTADTFWTLIGRLLAFGVCNSQPMCVRFDDSPVGNWIFDPF